MARQYKNEIERQYFRERDRVRKALSRMESRGIMEAGRLSNAGIMPAIPKKITEASVRRLQQTFSTEKLYRKMEYIDRETGEILAVGKQIKRIEREYKRATRAAQSRKTKGLDMPETSLRDVIDIPKAPKMRRIRMEAEDDLIINNLENQIRAMRSRAIPALLALLYSMKDRFGKRRVARIIENNASELHEVIERGYMTYKDEEVGPVGAKFERIMTAGLGKLERAEILDDPLYSKAQTEANINFEDWADFDEGDEE